MYNLTSDLMYNSRLRFFMNQILELTDFCVKCPYFCFFFKKIFNFLIDYKSRKNWNLPHKQSIGSICVLDTVITNVEHLACSTLCCHLWVNMSWSTINLGKGIFSFKNNTFSTLDELYNSKTKRKRNFLMLVLH